MTNSWEDLNAPRSARDEDATDDVVTAAAPRDPFKPFLAVAVATVLVFGGLMVLGSGSSGDPSEPSEPADPLALEVVPSTAQPTTSLVPTTQAPATTPLDTEEAIIQRMYVAAFGREPDKAGFEHWKSQLAAGQSLEDVAAAFVGTEEFQEQFGSRPVPRRVIELLYQNLLDRAPTADEVAFWLALDSEGLTVASMMVLFAETSAP